MSVEYQISTSVQAEKPKVVLRLASEGGTDRVSLYANDMMIITLESDGTLRRTHNAASGENLDAGLLFDANGRIKLQEDL